MQFVSPSQRCNSCSSQRCNSSSSQKVQFVFVTEVQFASPSQRCNVYRIRIIECIDVTEVQCVLFSYVVVVGRSRHRGAVVVLVVLIPRKFSSFEEILGSSKVGVCLRLRLVSDYGRLRSSSSSLVFVFRLRLSSSVTNFK